MPVQLHYNSAHGRINWPPLRAAYSDFLDAHQDLRSDEALRTGFIEQVAADLGVTFEAVQDEDEAEAPAAAVDEAVPDEDAQQPFTDPDPDAHTVADQLNAINQHFANLANRPIVVTIDYDKVLAATRRDRHTDGDRDSSGSSGDVPRGPDFQDQWNAAFLVELRRQYLLQEPEQRGGLRPLRLAVEHACDAVGDLDVD